MTEIAAGVDFLESALAFGVGCHSTTQEAEGGVLAALFQKSVIGLLAHAGRFQVAHGRVLPGRDVAQVTQQVHSLVVARHHVDAAALLCGLVLQAHQQVHHLAGVGAAIEQVSQADHVGGAAAPAQLRIHQAGGDE